MLSATDHLIRVDYDMMYLIEYIDAGLKKFVDSYQEKGINSISFPRLGCGNGGLNWEKEVKPLMEKYLRPLPINVFIHLQNNPVEVENLW